MTTESTQQPLGLFDGVVSAYESCEVCEGRPCVRVIDVGDRLLRVCVACAALFRREPAALLAALETAYSDEEER